MHRRHVAVAGVLVAALLLVLVWYPGTFVGPEDDRELYEHRVDPATASSYDQRLATIRSEAERNEGFEEGTDVEDELTTVSYEELSPAARATFDRTLEAPPDASGAHVYDPFVCRDGWRLCAGMQRSELPPEFGYGSGSPLDGAALIVETDDGRYLFSTGAVDYTPQDGAGFGLAIFTYVVKGVALIPFAAFLLAYSTGIATGSREWTAAGVTSGIALVALGVVFFDGTVAIGLLLGGLVLVAVATAPQTDDCRLRGLAVALGGLLATIAVAPSQLLPLIGSPSYPFLGGLLVLVGAWSSVAGLTAAAAWSGADRADAVGDGRSLPWK